MKNLFISLAVAAMFAVVSCGPSAAELEQKRVQDSIDSAQVADSIAAVEQAKLDSIAQADAAKAIADSIAADSIAKAGKKK